MELKNALAVCLIAVVSAALVVLIARALDNQAASRLEPQLAQIVEELRAIRTQGGITASGNAATTRPQERLVVYYFHGNIRCETCQAIESQAHEVVENDFGRQLESGQLEWKILNYENPALADLVAEFDVHMANVVLVRMDGQKQLNWRRLDKVWALWNDKPAFAEFMRTEIADMLDQQIVANEPAGMPSAPNLLDLPVPEFSPPPLPQDAPAGEIPLPE